MSNLLTEKIENVAHCELITRTKQPYGGAIMKIKAIANNKIFAYMLAVQQEKDKSKDKKYFEAIILDYEEYKQGWKKYEGNDYEQIIQIFKEQFPLGV